MAAMSSVPIIERMVGKISFSIPSRKGLAVTMKPTLGMRIFLKGCSPNA